MRGFPLANLLLILLLLAAAVYPVMQRITHRLDAAQPAVADLAAENTADANLKTEPVLLSLRMVHAPVEFQVRHGEAVLLSVKPEGAVLEQQAAVDLPWAENGVEFTLRIRWPEGTPETMAEVVVAPDGYGAQRQNVWSSGGEADEVLRFTWPKGGGL